MILLKEFAEGRNVNPHTVATYVRRHPDLFDGHTELDGKKLLLDDTAVEVLSKVYPALPPEDIWTPGAKRKYDELQEELREADKEIRILNQENREYRKMELEYRALQTEYQLQLTAAIDEKTAELQKEHEELKSLKAHLEKELASEMRRREEAEIQAERMKKAGFFERLKGWK